MIKSLRKIIKIYKNSSNFMSANSNYTRKWLRNKNKKR